MKAKNAMVNADSLSDIGEAGARRVNRVVDSVSTLRQVAYKELRDALLAGHFSPGEPITIRELAADLGLGIMPVREGIQQLSTQGALEFLPNRTVRVPLHTIGELEKIFEMRILIECYVTAKAADSITPERIAELARLLKSMSAPGGVNRNDPLKANHEFHFRIYECHDSPYLLEAIERLWLRIGPLQRAVLKSTKDDQKEFFQAIPLHASLIDALRAKKAQVASDILRVLLSKSLDWHKSHLNQQSVQPAISATPRRRGRAAS